MPKLINYPRTSYTGAWELAEIVDETGGKCSVENAASKMGRKVSGSFKAIIGSAVKFGLMTSKRDLLSNTTLFKRIKHAYDKQEEMQYHREAFLAPPLFTQICRKFRNRELPVQMLDVMLMREFGVEEINALGVAKVFVDGCRMCGLISEDNIVADIDQLLTTQGPKRSLSTPVPQLNEFTPKPATIAELRENKLKDSLPPSFNTTYQSSNLSLFDNTTTVLKHDNSSIIIDETDAVAALFEISPAATFSDSQVEDNEHYGNAPTATIGNTVAAGPENTEQIALTTLLPSKPKLYADSLIYQISVSGPGIDTSLELNDEADVEIAMALLEKIRRRFQKS